MEQQLRKTIEITSIEALKTILFMKFSITSPLETSLFSELLKLSGGQPLTLTPVIRDDVEKRIGYAGISTALGRIEKTGALRRQNKTIVFSPIFNNWDRTVQILFKINL